MHLCTSGGVVASKGFEPRSPALSGPRSLALEQNYEIWEGLGGGLCHGSGLHRVAGAEEDSGRAQKGCGHPGLNTQADWRELGRP